VKYMLLIYTDPNSAPAPGSAENQAEHARWIDFSRELFESGKGLAGDPLQGIETATTVRVRGGDRLTTDGPFAETKEILGGYYLIDVDDLDEALEIAGRMPNIDYGTVEVRPIMDFPV
jgi:hypothetical protein